MSLTDVQVRNAKPTDKQYKLAAGKGLYLVVSPKGGKWWRVRYRFSGKQKELSVGTYPDVSLKLATSRRDELRQKLEKGIDPSKERKLEKITAKHADERTFEVIARDWMDKFGADWTDKYKKLTKSRLEQNAFPWIGNSDIDSITAPELLIILRKVESRGALETAHRVRKLCSCVFRYAIANGVAQRDPAADLVGALPPTKTKHLASITDPKMVGALLRAVDGYDGQFITKCALKLSALVMLRPVNIRSSKWEDIDLDTAQWKIPMGSMKMRRTHIVPLSKQAIDILKEVRALTGGGTFVFPSIRTKQRPMSENTITAALRRLGYSGDEMTAHGFRSMASTILHEQGYNSDWVELQLAHVDGNTVRASYNYAQYLPERKRMMQDWADYLDALKAGAEVISIKSKSAV